MANGIFGAILDNLVDYDIRGGYPDVIHVSGDVYAVSCWGTLQDGMLYTFSIDSDGAITIIDNFPFDGGFHATYHSIIHISGDYYAIAYSGADEDGWLCTVTITSAGVIGGAVVSTLEFDGAHCGKCKIIHVSGDVYAIAYQGSGVDGYVVTVDISPVGIIAPAVIDSWEFDPIRGAFPDIIKIAGTTYAIVYSGTAGDYDGVVFSLTIANNGVITPAAIGSLTFSTDCWDVNILHVSGDVYAIAVIGLTDLSVVTVTINPAGAISAVIDTLVVDSAAIGNYPLSFIHVADDVYVVAYTGLDWHGYIASMTITAGGTITAVDSLEYYTVFDAVQPSVVAASSSVLVVAYQATGDGDISTIAITPYLPTVQTLPATGVT